MKNFKFLKENSNFTLTINDESFGGSLIFGVGVTTLTNSTIIGENAYDEHSEFVFQFDDDEPMSFTQGAISLTLSVRAGSSIGFNSNGKRFKIFSREVQNRGNHEISLRNNSINGAG